MKIVFFSNLDLLGCECWPDEKDLMGFIPNVGDFVSSRFMHPVYAKDEHGRPYGEPIVKFCGDEIPRKIHHNNLKKVNW